MKNIGVLTFHNTLNYGAILQAFALEKCLQKSGYRAEIIDYQCDAIQKREFPSNLSEVKGIKDKFKFIFGSKKRKAKEKEFTKFMLSYMDITPKKYSLQDIDTIEEKYDYIICGSDQIWNMVLTGGDTSYTLDFIKNTDKKISYAASFGYSEVPDKYLLLTQAKLKENFKKLSVREKQGASIIKELTGIESEVVLDPTLLLNKNDWLSVLDIKRNKDNVKPYILVYLPHDKKTVFKFAKKLAREKDCKIYYVNITYIHYPGVENFYDLSPRQFLEMINNASYIVTGSFHGVALSINFEKTFFYEDSLSANKYGSRVSNLIHLLGLENQSIEFNRDNYEKIDFESIQKQLCLERKRSLDFLLEGIMS